MHVGVQHGSGQQPAWSGLCSLVAACTDPSQAPIICSTGSLAKLACCPSQCDTQLTYLSEVISLLKKGEGLSPLPALHSAGGGG